MRLFFLLDSLSLSVSLCSPDTLAQGCETSSDVNAGIQKLIPNQEALEESSESTEAGCVLSCPADPGSEQRLHQSRPSQTIHRKPPELECTSQGYVFCFVFGWSVLFHAEIMFFTLKDLTRWQCQTCSHHFEKTFASLIPPLCLFQNSNVNTPLRFNVSFSTGLLHIARCYHSPPYQRRKRGERIEQHLPHQSQTTLQWCAFFIFSIFIFIYIVLFSLTHWTLSPVVSISSFEYHSATTVSVIFHINF